MDKICKKCVLKNVDPETKEIIMGGACMHCSDHDCFIDKDSPEGQEELKRQEEAKQIEKFLKENENKPTCYRAGKDFKLLEDVDTTLCNLIEGIKDLQQENEELRQENKKLRSTDDVFAKLNDLDKIELLTDLQHELERYPLITLSKKEMEAIVAFRDKHYEKCKKGVSHGAIGYDEYIYTIGGTGIGNVIKIKCPICGMEEDVTDTESW